MAKDKHAYGMLSITASGHLSDEPKVLSDSSPYIMKTKALSVLPAHTPPVSFHLLHTPLLSEEKKKRSLSEVYGTMVHRCIGRRKTCVSAWFSYGIKELNSAWLSIAWWWWISLMAGLKRSSSRLGRLFMVPVSVISLWQTTRKEGMKQRWKDGREERKCFFCQTTHTSSKGKEEEMKRQNIKTVQQGLWGKKKKIAMCLTDELEMRDWMCFQCMYVLGWLVVSHCSLPGDY